MLPMEPKLVEDSVSPRVGWVEGVHVGDAAVGPSAMGGVSTQVVRTLGSEFLDEPSRVGSDHRDLRSG